VLALSMPCVRVRYRFVQRSGTPIEQLVHEAIARDDMAGAPG
jgi:hypothetical protein